MKKTIFPKIPNYCFYRSNDIIQKGLLHTVCMLSICRDGGIYISKDSHTRKSRHANVSHTHTLSIQAPVHTDVHTHTYSTHTLRHSIKNWSLLNQPKYFKQNQYLFKIIHEKYFTIKIKKK